MVRDRTLGAVLLAALLSCALVVGFGGGLSAAGAATIRVVYGDGGSEGFNDPRPATPIGGNDGVTIGEQRRNAVARAAEIWADLLDSNVTIRFAVSFDPLACEDRSAVLGQASPNSVHSDFVGAPQAGTLYPAALANRLAGVDLCPPGSCRNSSDVEATFNSVFGTTCRFDGGWYYGLDGAPPAGRADLVTVALHELGHGLGFLSLVDPASGEKFLGMDDAFSNFVEDHGRRATFDALTDGERADAIVSGSDLHFIGPRLLNLASASVSGLGDGGHVRLYAPAMASGGSSLSHFDEVLSPIQLMEPSLDGAIHDVGLAIGLLEDLGWGVLAEVCGGDCDGDQRVSTSDLVLAVRVALGEAAVGECLPGDGDNDGGIAIAELIVGVRNALRGCGGTILESSGLVRSGGVSAGPRCPGDCDGDGRVAVGELVTGVNIALGRADAASCESMDGDGNGRVGINELIAAVASALDGCPCPFDFLDERAGDEEACVFAGRWNGQCGDSALPATFSVQPGLVGVAVVTGADSPTLTFFGQPLTAREASMVGFMFGDEAVQLPGRIRLSEDGRRLSIEPEAAVDVSIDECAFERYDGDIESIVLISDGGAVSPLLDRLRALTASGLSFDAMQ